MTQAQLQAIALLAAGRTELEVAKELSISKRTLQRWKTGYEFSQALAETVTKSVQKSVEVVSDHVADYFSRVNRLVHKSLDVVEQYLDDPEARASDRLKAAQLLLSQVSLKPKINLEASLEQHFQRCLVECDDQVKLLYSVFVKAYGDQDWNLCLAIIKDLGDRTGSYPEIVGELQAVKTLAEAEWMPNEFLEIGEQCLDKMKDQMSKAFRQSLKLEEVTQNSN